MFDTMGKLVTRRPLWVAAAWLLALAALLRWAPALKDVRTRDEASLVPPDQPSNVAVQELRKRFEVPPPRSVAAIVLARSGGLTSVPEQNSADAAPAGSDFRFIQDLTGRLETLAAPESWQLFSPSDKRWALLRNNLMPPSADGQYPAAVVLIDLPYNFVSHEAIAAIDRIGETVRQVGTPAGLELAVTGSASYGHDYFDATEKSLDRTTWVTVVAVIVVLLLTYRAALAAVISLLTITAAVVISISLLAIGGAHGWSVSTIVELFTIVIGYGAGVDFSLFFLSRYHEELGRFGAGRGRRSRAQRRRAAQRALTRIGPAVLASAATVAAGLALMYFAEFRVFRTAGPAVALSVIVSCLASLTLTPAIACLAGAATFWPRRFAPPSPEHSGPGRGFWSRLARLAVSHPLLILLVGLAALTPVAVFGFRQEVVYDTLADLPPSNESVRGAELFKRHYPIGEMAPLRLMLEVDRPLDEEKWIALIAAADRSLAGWKTPPNLAPVQEVRSLIHPLGVKQRLQIRVGPLMLNRFSFESPAARALRADDYAQARARHLATDRQAARWDIAVAAPSYSNRAMATLDPLTRRLADAAASVLGDDIHVRILIAGDTAQMRDVKRVTRRDFHVVGGLVVGAIVLIVLLLVRDLPVALFVMIATILSYGAALGLTSWLFGMLFGVAGPDWKVEFFLFVILVAVGQDYNLFILSRIAEERRRKPLRPATESAIARTGAIISCCGLIMAATLGSLASSPLRLLQELGVAFVIGLLIDTFLVRPLMVPAFVLVLRRMGRGQIAVAHSPVADASTAAAGD